MTDEAVPTSREEGQAPKTEKVAPLGPARISHASVDELREIVTLQEARIAALEKRLAAGEETSARPAWPSLFLASARRFHPATIAAFATATALVLGLSLFSLVRSAQWRSALSDLRAEPGIAVLDITSAGPFRREIAGLRDPLAPTVEEILARHGLGPRSARLFFTEYASLHTAYAEERRRLSGAETQELHDSLVEVVHQFAEEAERRSEEDLEKLTKTVLEARFPEEMKSVDVRFRGGRWQFRGGLYEPAHTLFSSEAPAFLVRGRRDFGGLANLTEIESARLVESIEGADLFRRDDFGTLVNLPRLARLVRDLDALHERSRLPAARLRIECSPVGAAGEEGPDLDALAETVRTRLTSEAGVAPDRFLPTVRTAGLETSGRLGVVPVSVE